MQALILDCLQKKPAQRPQNVKAIRQQLGAIDLPQPWTSELAQCWWQSHALDDQSVSVSSGDTATVQMD